MKISIVDILVMGASISTMIGLIIAIITLRYLYFEKKEKTEYEIKKHFFDGSKWILWNPDNVIDGQSKSNVVAYFELHISDKCTLYRFIGKISCPEFNNTGELLMFSFKKSCQKKITLEIHQIIKLSETNMSRDILGTATLKYLSPDLFTITFNKDCLPYFPRLAYITSNDV